MKKNYEEKCSCLHSNSSVIVLSIIDRIISRKIWKENTDGRINERISKLSNIHFHDEDFFFLPNRYLVTLISIVRQ